MLLGQDALVREAFCFAGGGQRHGKDLDPRGSSLWMFLKIV